MSQVGARTDTVSDRMAVLGFLGFLRFLGLGTIIRFSSKGLGTIGSQTQVLIWANVAGWHQGTDRVASHKLVYLGRGWCEV